MEDRSLRFYLDELMPVAIAEQLNRRGLDTIARRISWNHSGVELPQNLFYN